MSNFIFITTILTSGLLFASCDRETTEQNIYPGDLTLSQTNGEPIDSFTFYFPTSIKRDTVAVQTDIDSFRNEWYSGSLYAAKEPVLHNFYLGHDIYRFLWLRAFSPPLVFSLHKDGSKVWLTTKKLDREPSFIPMTTKIRFLPPGTDGRIYEFSDEELARQQAEADSFNRVRKIAHIILNETKELSINEWKKFEQLLNECSYWTMPTSIPVMGVDGSHWIIEAHLNDKYWVVDRWVPQDNYRKCGEYLIDLSGVKEEPY